MLQIYEDPPSITYCEKVSSNGLEPSINHLKHLNLILVAGDHSTDPKKISVNLFTDVAPFEKV